MFRRNRQTPPQSPPPTQESSADPTLTDHGILDQYVRGAPSDQNALDLFQDTWSFGLPPEFQLNAGTLPGYADGRIVSAINHLGGVDGMKVLELGPLEASHSYMLHEAGATVVAVEGSARAYVKCLIVKEILGMQRARFLLGDFVPYLHETNEQFDLVLASGVLYHMQDPIDLLESMAKVTSKIVIWTHYFDADAVSASAGVSRTFVDDPTEVHWHDRTLTLHPRHYLEALGWGGFCGGPEASARWMERDGLMSVLGDLGFGSITVLSEDVDHVNGPSILLCAER